MANSMIFPLFINLPLTALGLMMKLLTYLMIGLFTAK